MDDYPYIATWCETVEQADNEDYGWVHWNGVAMMWPNFVRYKGVTYTFENFKKEIWKL